MKAQRQRLSLLEAAFAGAALVTVVLIVLWYAWVRTLVADVAELRADRLHQCRQAVSGVRGLKGWITNPKFARLQTEFMYSLSGQLSVWQAQLYDCWRHLSTAEWGPVEHKLGSAAQILAGGRREDAAVELSEAMRLIDEEPWSRWRR